MSTTNIFKFFIRRLLTFTGNRVSTYLWCDFSKDYSFMCGSLINPLRVSHYCWIVYSIVPFFISWLLAYLFEPMRMSVSGSEQGYDEWDNKQLYRWNCFACIIFFPRMVSSRVGMSDSMSQWNWNYFFFFLYIHVQNLLFILPYVAMRFVS